MKNSDTIGNRSRDLPVCSAVPQPLRYRVPLLYTVEPLLSGLMTGCRWPENKKITDNQRQPENDLLLPPYVYVKII
jgi:hypothetical protein